MMTGPIDPRDISSAARSRSVFDQYAYSEPGADEQSYTITGFEIPDEPGQILITAPGDPFQVTVRLEANYRRSIAWWASAWMPRRWRVALCAKYGHPTKCVGQSMRSEMIALSHTHAGDTYSVEMRQVDGTQSVVDRWCHRCGEHGLPDAP